MPQANILTDAKLKQLYYEIADDYAFLSGIQTPFPLTAAQIAEELNRRLYNSLTNPSCPLYSLPDVEKDKAFTVLNTYLRACQHNTFIHNQNNLVRINYSYLNPPPITTPTYVIIDNRPHRSYCASNDFLITWMLLNMVGRSNHQIHPHGSIFPSSNTHGHSRKRKDKEEAEAAAQAQFWAMVVVVCAIIAAIASAFIALYYLLNEVNASLNRFIYNEGWIQALVSLSSIAASGFTSFILANTFVTPPLIGLAITAGLANPVGFAVFGVLAISLIGAAVGGYLTNLVQNFIISSFNKDALDPNDPHRFELTDKETRNLISKGIDPIKVKCAIIALRAEIGKEKVPGFINRLFIQHGGRISKCLDDIRQLRKGNLKVVGVGPLTFDCQQVQTVTVQVAPQLPQLGMRFFSPQQLIVVPTVPEASAPFISPQVDKQLPSIILPVEVVQVLPPSAPPSEPTEVVVAANNPSVDENPRPIVAGQFR